MKYNSLFFLFIIIAALFNSLQAAELRHWTGSNGKKIEAEFISFDKESEIVLIRLKNGKEQKVKLSLFSKQDQEFVRNGGKTGDNPFDIGDSKLTGPLRGIFSFSDQNGNSTYRLEKATEPYKDDFIGEPIKLKLLPKTNVFKAKDGTLKMVYDFSDSDSLSDLFSYCLVEKMVLL